MKAIDLEKALSNLGNPKGKSVRKPIWGPNGLIKASPEAAETLLTLARSETATARKDAAMALGELGMVSREILTTLQTLGKDDSNDVRNAAVATLADLSLLSAEATDVLNRLFKEDLDAICQSEEAIGLEWRINCPSWRELLEFKMSGVEFRHAQAMQFHIEHDHCTRCEQLLHPKPLAALIKAAQEFGSNARAVFTFGMAPKLAMAEFKTKEGSRSAPFLLRQSTNDLTVTLLEKDGELLVTVDAAKQQAPKAAHVRIVGRQEEIDLDVPLEVYDDTEAGGTVSAGPFRDAIMRLGAGEEIAVMVFIKE